MTEWKEQEFKKNFDLSTWLKLFKFIKPYKTIMVCLAIVMVFTAIIDGILPLFTKYAIDNFITSGTLDGIKIFIILFISVISFQALSIFTLIVLAAKIEVGVSYDIRKKAFKKLQDLQFSYFDKTPTGWIMSRMTSDCERLSETLAWGIVDVSWGFAMMIGIVVIMFVLNWQLALISMMVIPFLVLISLWFQKRILKNYRRVRKINSRLTSAVNESIIGAGTTKTLVCEEKSFNEFQGLTVSMKKASVKAAVLSSLYMPIALSLCTIGTSLVLWRGGNNLIAEAMTIGTLIAFIQYTVQFFDPVLELARMFAEIQGAQAAAERLVSLLDTEIEIFDKPEVVEIYGTYFEPKTTNYPAIKGSVEFKNVSFKYDNGSNVLSDFNISLEAGQTVALVGETGSGKTTIASLICRFYEPQQGCIMLDGIDLKKRSLHWLHSNIGYVLQSPHLFSGTIKENILYGNLRATEKEIIKAAELVDAHEFISEMKDGYNTLIGEGGNSLSTGQKQLVSFARAIIADPKIFILDEATSSIDTEMEKKIQKALLTVLKNRTSIVIAHRLSTIVNADRIVVLKNGKILETGTHQDLLINKDYYYKLYTRQFAREQTLVMGETS